MLVAIGGKDNRAQINSREMVIVKNTKLRKRRYGKP